MSKNSKEKKSDATHEIVSFYHFVSFPGQKLKKMSDMLMKNGEEWKITGLILLSTEGINATISGKSENISKYLKTIEQLTGINDFFYKKSATELPAFKKLKVKMKREIITFRKKSAKKEASASFGFHDLEPDEWESILNENQVTVLDIRNDYEVELGQFKKAKHLDLKEFNEFPQKIKSSALPKEQKTLLYCTGGIRCEKAIAEMKKQGFKELYQLKGGIIHYLKSFPNKSFRGECFVFDHRVAVDQNLKSSSKYSLCPHCGQAAGKHIKCGHCGKQTKICKKCLEKKQPYLMTCTKNCAHHFRMKHKCKKHQSGTHTPSIRKSIV